jgi:hypothetical protein
MPTVELLHRVVTPSLGGGATGAETAGAASAERLPVRALRAGVDAGGAEDRRDERPSRRAAGNPGPVRATARLPVPVYPGARFTGGWGFGAGRYDQRSAGAHDPAPLREIRR